MIKMCKKLIVLIALLFSQFCSQTILADGTFFPESLFVYFNNGDVTAFPNQYIKNHTETEDGLLKIETVMGQTFIYKMSEVSSIKTEAPTDLPTITSFKINNKFNDQVFSDCIGEINGSEINLTVPAIGKYLTPSMKVSDSTCEIFINGEKQKSKESRLRFDKPITYVVAKPGHTILMPRESIGGDIYTFQPYGTVYTVNVSWPTDEVTEVTGFPKIEITTDDGLMVDSKTEYKTATIKFDGMGIFPSMTETVNIKGRGNTSWNFDKKPYRLKFSKKVKPFGMKAGKNWVLLANNRSGSLMTNAIGMKAANLIGTAYPNHIIPVELYMNGEYRGNYNITEKVGFANNCIEFRDESDAVLLEFDSNGGDPADQTFKSITYGKYKLPVIVKSPTFSEGKTNLTLTEVKNDFNQFLTKLQNGEPISDIVEIDYLARYLMANEVICNTEFFYPKSDFCFRESLKSDTSKYVFGPVWDLDYGFGYPKSQNSYFKSWATNDFWTETNSQTRIAWSFVNDLRYKDKEVDDAYHRIWREFKNKKATELYDFCLDYYNFVKPSIENDQAKWSDKTKYAQQAKDAVNWLSARIEAITERLEQTNENPIKMYDVNLDNYINGGDAVAAVSLMMNSALEQYSKEAADINSDSIVSERDAVAIIEKVLTNADREDGATSTDDAIELNCTNKRIDFILKNTKDYTAFHFTLTLPESASIEKIIFDESRTEQHQISYIKNEDNSYEVFGFSLNNNEITGNEGKLLSIYANGLGENLAGASDVRFFTKDSQSWSIKNITANLSPDDTLKGDANGDGNVDSADIIEIVNFIMGRKSNKFNETNADANGDNTVNAADIVAIVNIIMNVL